jgi:hypothetical protein
MPDRERERIGPFVVTTARNLDPESIICANCGKSLARANGELWLPSPEELITSGAIAWPNFGWFCSVECERAFSQEFRVSCAEREATDGADNPPVRRIGAAGIFSGIRNWFGRGSGP